MQHASATTPAASPQVLHLSLSIQEAAATCRISKSLLYHYMRNGELAFVKVGARRLILVSDLEAFLRRFRQGEVVA